MGFQTRERDRALEVHDRVPAFAGHRHADLMWAYENGLDVVLGAQVPDEGDVYVEELRALMRDDVGHCPIDLQGRLNIGGGVGYL